MHPDSLQGSSFQETNDTAINAGHIYLPHGHTLQDIAEQTNTIIGIRDVNPLTAKRFEEHTEIVKNEDGTETKIYHAEGKDYNTKFKSSLLGVIAAYIPIDSILAKQGDQDADKKMTEMLTDQRETYRALPLDTTIDGEKYEVFYHVKNRASREVDVILKHQDGRYFLEDGAGGLLEETTPDTEALKRVTVLYNVPNNTVIIPDYDLAIIGRRVRDSIFFVKEPGMSSLPLDTIGFLKELKVRTNNMIQHASDSFNPKAYGFEISVATPYTIFLPDRKVISLITPEEFVDFLNEWRGKGYNLVPNPKMGVEIGADGKLFIPTTETSFNWRKIDEDIQSIEKASQAATLLVDAAAVENMGENDGDMLLSIIGYLPPEIRNKANIILDHAENPYPDLAKLFCETKVKGIISDETTLAEHIAERAALAGYIADAQVKLKFSEMILWQLPSSQLGPKPEPEMSEGEFAIGIVAQKEKIAYFNAIYKERYEEASPVALAEESQREAIHRNLQREQQSAEGHWRWVEHVGSSTRKQSWTDTVAGKTDESAPLLPHQTGK